MTTPTSETPETDAVIFTVRQEHVGTLVTTVADMADLETRLRAAELKLQEAEKENMCDACAGTGTPTSSGECMCGGTGKMSDAAYYLRERLADADLPAKLMRAQTVDPVVWFIERTGLEGSPPHPYDRWLSHFHYEDSVWTNDPHDALWFSRKKDVEKFMQIGRLPSLAGFTLIATDHVFISRSLPPADPDVQKITEDAERYRWLRDDKNVYMASQMITTMAFCEQSLDDAIDGAIDAALNPAGGSAGGREVKIKFNDHDCIVRVSTSSYLGPMQRSRACRNNATVKTKSGWMCKFHAKRATRTSD